MGGRRSGDWVYDVTLAPNACFERPEADETQDAPEPTDRDDCAEPGVDTTRGGATSPQFLMLARERPATSSV